MNETRFFAALMALRYGILEDVSEEAALEVCGAIAKVMRLQGAHIDEAHRELFHGSPSELVETAQALYWALRDNGLSIEAAVGETFTELLRELSGEPELAVA